MEAGAFALTAEDIQFLRDVSDAIRHEQDERAIMRDLAAMIGAYFDVSRCLFVDLAAGDGLLIAGDYHLPQLLPVAGSYPMSTMTSETLAKLRAGTTVCFPEPDRSAPPPEHLAEWTEMRIAAFVSVPFLRDGQLTGMLAVTAAQQRAWTVRELSLLAIASDRVWLAIELHRALRHAARELRASAEQLERSVRERTAALSRSEQNFRAIIEAAPYGVLVHRGEMLYANPALLAILGHADSGALVGKHFEALVYPEDLPRAQERARRAMRGLANPPFELRMRTRTGEPIWVESTSLQCTYDGRTAVAVMFRDVTERRQADLELKASLREKEVLLKEIHHRVKNNLQVVSSLLYLQSRRITDPVARAQLEESQARVGSISLVHELLYRSKDLSVIDFREYVGALITNLAFAADAAARGIDVRSAIDPVRLTVDSAIASGLILCELVTNAMKHAFPGGRPGRIDVTVRADRTAVELAVADDGVGLPPALDPRATTTLGLELVSTLTDQLRGQLAVERAPTRFVVSFGGSDA